MKTLLEWLEDNRCNLKDGVYRVGWPGVIVHDGVTLSEPEGEPISLTKEEYVLKNGSISLIPETNRMKTLLEFLEENCGGLRDGIYEVSGMGNLVYNGTTYAGSAYGDGELDGEGFTYRLNNGVITRVVNCNVSNKSKPKSFHKTASDYLKDGADLLSERGKQYDKSGQERSMEKIVRIFNDMTGQDLTTVQGWYFMQVLKDVRFFQNPETVHEDSLLDKISYAALLAEEALKNDE